ncbi:MAG TPA: helix-turn-helix domain-containing protein [Thermoleophilaceae bacterium]
MNNRPWATLDPAVAAPLRPRVPTLVDEVIDAVQTAVPDYEALDPAVTRGVRVALDGFLDLVEAGDETRLPGRDVYERFGQAEARNGRSLEALLAAYRAGARVAWRGFAEAGHEAGVDPEALYTLAEAIFAYIDEISAASAEGHAREQSAAAREQQERRRRLVDALLREPQPAEVPQLAQAAGWELPARVAALAFDGDAPDRVDARLGAFALVARIEGIGWALVPDPFAPGRRAEIERALGGAGAAIGPEVAPADTARSARRARLALGLVDGLVVADEHLLDLILGRDEELSRELAERRLAPLDVLPAAARERLLDTLHAWLDAHGEARPAAAALHVHVQTVRYRLGQLRDLLGNSLDDPDARLELALALRVARA